MRLYGSSGSMANSVGAGEAESSASGLSQQLSFSQACSLIKNPYSCLVLDTCRRHIALSPQYLKRQRSGIERQLRTELLRFSESLIATKPPLLPGFDPWFSLDLLQVQHTPKDLSLPLASGDGQLVKYQLKGGVPIAYDKVRLVGELGDIYDDQGYIHLNIEADFVIFRPKTGQKLVGVVNKVAPSHLGCLVHGCFNASIPKPHHANGIWPGFAVTVGDSLKFEVLQLDADVAGVLCIRGQLDKSVQAAYGVDSEEPLEKNSDQDDEIASKKKKKKRHKGEKCVREGTTEEAVCCEISDESLHKDGMGNTKIISDSNKFKKRKRKTVELNTDTEIHGRDDGDYHSDKAIKKKKRKLSEGDSEPTNCTKEPKCKKK